MSRSSGSDPTEKAIRTRPRAFRSGDDGGPNADVQLSWPSGWGAVALAALASRCRCSPA
jgi:hypothetical protein